MSVKLVRALLTGAGHVVRSAKSAEEALAVLKTFDPRLILIDIQLPGVNGLELASQLRSNLTMQKTSLVALTAYAMTGDEQKARNAGCDGYITKPIDVRTLPSVVNKFLKEEHIHEGLPSSMMPQKPGDGPGTNTRDSAASESAGSLSNGERPRAVTGLPQQPASGHNEDLLAEL